MRRKRLVFVEQVEDKGHGHVGIGGQISAEKGRRNPIKAALLKSYRMAGIFHAGNQRLFPDNTSHPGIERARRTSIFIFCGKEYGEHRPKPPQSRTGWPRSWR